MRDVPETPFFSTFFGVLGGPLLQFKSPPRYLNEEIRNVGCPAFLFFCVWKIWKHMPGGFSVRRKQYFCVMVGNDTLNMQRELCEGNYTRRSKGLRSTAK